MTSRRWDDREADATTPDLRAERLYTTGTCANPEGQRGGLVELWNVRWSYGGCLDEEFSRVLGP